MLITINDKLASIADALRATATTALLNGERPKSLLTVSNQKTLKSLKKGYRTFIMHFAPAMLSGSNVCPHASPGCIGGCLNTAGHGGMIKNDATLPARDRAVVQYARILRTQFFTMYTGEFMDSLTKEITRGIKSAERAGLIPTFRLNGTSDIKWENVRPNNSPVVNAASIFEAFPGIQFYDYTKIPGRQSLPPNYHLTYSRAETTSDATVKEQIENGRNVAAVFSATLGLPETWLGYPVLNGDVSDLRFLDAPNSIVGLTAKGSAKRDTSGFTLYVDTDGIAQ